MTTAVTFDSSRPSANASALVFMMPVVFSGITFAFIKPELVLVPMAMFGIALLPLIRIFKRRKVVVVAVLALGFASCASPNYWGASATSYGARAQKQYIKNQRGHNPGRRFQSSNQPTFGAQDISRNR